MSYLNVQEFLQYKFTDEANLRKALHHSSSGGLDFERMEFLGDRVLSICLARKLYLKYPQDTEGDLAKRHAVLVSGKVILEVMSDLDLFHIAKFNKSIKEKPFNSIKIDICEAIFAGIFIDSGFENAYSVISYLWDDLITQDSVPPVDAKTSLQEYLQSMRKSIPQYEIKNQSGPDHDPLFTIQLSIKEDGLFFKSTGSSKQEAEKNAAIQALQFFKKI